MFEICGMYCRGALASFITYFLYSTHVSETNTALYPPVACYCHGSASVGRLEHNCRRP